MIIRNQENKIYADSYGPVDGKYGLAVVFDDESPSGCSRPRMLLESGPIYPTPEAAKNHAESIIKDVLELPEELI
jgi:hypothetical protein